jgi:hypothetical protein
VKKEETVKNWIFLADGDLKTAQDELNILSHLQIQFASILSSVLKNI